MLVTCPKETRRLNTSLLLLLIIIIIIIIISGVRLSPLGTASTTGLFYQPQMIDGGDCGVISGIKVDRGNRSTQMKPSPAPLCPPQIPHDHIRARTRPAAVGSQRLTAWVMARPAWGYNWATLSLGDINTETCSSRLGLDTLLSKDFIIAKSK
jgi:hypothetical protein